MTVVEKRKTMMVSAKAHKAVSEASRRYKLSTVVVCDHIMDMIDLNQLNERLDRAQRSKRENRQDLARKREHAIKLADTLSLSEIDALADDPTLLAKIRTLIKPTEPAAT